MISNLFKVLSDDTRIKILKIIAAEQEVCGCMLLEKLNINQSTLSHHMKLLVENELVNVRKDWKWSHYSINKETIKQLCQVLEKEFM